ncbi:S-adenosyl-L-homocysteine hydrolase [Sulfitobacter albidus]|uniref:S-adenosyl-L-homocysteine hydrolase n=1 Tax=Sulfitobacter albidus TaxID=2829501 RepID=A0A975JCX5_9RHOB|nr:S-adenosyl-L-homocysteine hydrolase [Sulfitobacter albidus]QUJ76156.1 S-adenosyl-L-homocysteine hydrolase [Sulfitobacter albidus]
MKTLIATALTVTTLGTAAVAQDVCMPAAEMQSSLIDWYGEAPVAGPSQDNTRLWVSDASGTWTLVRTLADGNACVEATGENWSPDRDAEQLLAALEARNDS